MLSTSYLTAGLNALSRSYPDAVWSWDNFSNGHRGAATISAYFMSQERQIDDTGSMAVQALIDAEYMGKSVFSPMEEEAPAPRALEELLASFWNVAGSSDHAGHHVIFPSLALKALRQDPRLVTQSRIHGLLQLCKVYTPENPHQIGHASLTFDAREFSNWVLGEFNAIAPAFDLHGQGYTGHLLTFGCAVMDLYDMGYTELARRAEFGYRHYVTLARQGPTGAFNGGKGKAASPPRAVHLDRGSHWQSLPVGCLESSIGHQVKYVYAMNRFLALANDDAIKRQTVSLLYLVF